MTTNDTSRSLSALSAYESDLEKIVTHRLSAEIYEDALMICDQMKVSSVSKFAALTLLEMYYANRSTFSIPWNDHRERSVVPLICARLACKFYERNTLSYVELLKVSRRFTHFNRVCDLKSAELIVLDVINFRLMLGGLVWKRLHCYMEKMKIFFSLEARVESELIYLAEKFLELSYEEECIWENAAIVDISLSIILASTIVLAVEDQGEIKNWMATIEPKQSVETAVGLSQKLHLLANLK